MEGELIFTACAWIKKPNDSTSIYSVTLYGGLVFNLNVLFSALLSNPKVFPDLDCTDCIPFGSTFPLEVQAIRWDDGLRHQIRALSDANVRLFRSTPERAQVARDLLRMAAAFTLWHEIGHVQCAHLDMLLLYHEQPMATERENYRILPVQAWHGMELQADTHGLMGLFLLNIGDSAHLARLAGFALGCVFLIFDEARSRIREFDDSQHPHPSVRYFYAFRGMERLRRRRLPVSDQVQSAFEAGLVESAYACGSIGFDVIPMVKHDVAEVNKRIETAFDVLDELQIKHGYARTLWSPIDALMSPEAQKIMRKDDTQQ
jgi:hypothetical protein